MTHSLDALFATIESRKGDLDSGKVGPETSYTAKLLAGGAPLRAGELSRRGRVSHHYVPISTERAQRYIRS